MEEAKETMNGRDVILGRIREALKISAPAPHTKGLVGGHASTPRDWLPPVGESFEERAALFQKSAHALKATFELHPSLDSAVRSVAALASAEGWKRVASHRSALTAPLLEALAAAGIGHLTTDEGYEVSAMEACDAGITTCESLVAQTGSVLVSSTGNGGRALSVLPPHHIVIATRDQMLPDLHAALSAARTKFGDTYPSMLSFITGPSRTGDIERILVLGAHGPRQLTILVVPEAG